MTYFLLGSAALAVAWAAWYFIGRDDATEFQRGIVWLSLMAGLVSVVGVEFLLDLLRVLARTVR